MVVNHSLKIGIRSSTERFMFQSDTQVLTNKDDRLSQSTLCNTSFILPNYVPDGDFHFANTNTPSITYIQNDSKQTNPYQWSLKIFGIICLQARQSYHSNSKVNNKTSHFGTSAPS